MKTARENPNRWATLNCNRVHGAEGQNSSRSFQWAAKKEKFRAGGVFFLTSSFIELTGHSPRMSGTVYQAFGNKHRLFGYIEG
jgi:hypothetical protein